MPQAAAQAVDRGFDLFDYLSDRKRTIFNVLIPAGFISYAALDHGLGRILFWSYLWLIVLFGLTYRLYYQEPRRSFRVPKGDKFVINSWKEAFNVGSSDINVVLGVAVTVALWLAICGAFCIVTFGTVILTICCAVVASFDFLWDWHVNLHPYINLITWWMHLSIWR